MNSEQQFTPGPWTWTARDDVLALHGPEGSDLSDAVLDAYTDRCHASLSVADAALIGAAPDLYAALYRLVAAYRAAGNRPMGPGTGFEQAVKALARARGENQ